VKVGPINISRANEAQRLTEQLTQQRWQSGFLAENLNVLEQQLAGDTEWRRQAMTTKMEFTRPGLDDLCAVSKIMYLSNPLVQRAVNVTTYYTWAQGWQFQAEEQRIQDEVVQPMLDDEGNRLALYGHQAQLLTDVDQLCDGNVFLCLFTSMAGDVKVRSMPTQEIREIICNPNDREQVWFYRRVWGQMEFDLATGVNYAGAYEALYPDIRYQPRNRPATIGGVDVHWDAPIIHQRTGGFKNMLFGVPQTYAALDWARAYKKFLEDWHTIVSSLARFAWRATTKGRKIDRLKGKLGASAQAQEELAEDPFSSPGGPARAPIPGSVFAGTADDNLQPINKAGATTGTADARPARLMVGAAMDLPDTILSGDADQGNLATSKTLDRPTELGFMNRQTMWADLHARVFRYAVDAKVRAGQLPGRVVRDYDGTHVEPGIDAQVDLVFPPILEHDQQTTVESIVAAATLQNYNDAGTIPREEVSTLLMQALGVENIEQALEDLDKEQNVLIDQAVAKLQGMMAGGDLPAPGEPTVPGGS
jgi:hypothetical protein